jgi:hypothetical protein
MATPTQTAPSQQAGNGSKKQQTVALRPFITGTRRIDQQTYDQTRTLTASTQRLPTYEFDTDGYVRGVYVLAEITSAGNSAATAFNQDGAVNAFQTVQFSDTNNKPIVGPFTGHDLGMVQKYGGYAYSGDPKASALYSATTGTGATGGSATFVLRLPIEIRGRDGLGALENKSASAVYKLDLTLNSIAGLYATAPTAAPSIRVRVEQFGWMDSDQADYMKSPADPNPPALNTVQYWDKQTITVSAGAINQRLNTFSGLVRNLIFELRDTAGARTDADFPDPFELHYDKTVPIQRLRQIWQHQVSEYWGYRGAEAIGTANTLDTGVFPEPYTLDYGLQPGAESSFGYLPVTSATSLVVRGTVGGSGSHTLNVLVNYVWPANGDPKSLTGGR